ncbi:hypothetical protein EGW08_016559 [Elysia chlorotica]|uniref:Integrase catalytic domain-containing protein n=1 Tax=Elysia chlorotica TaxID=188477 RepID=A0A3S1BA27_ELYCH|nr:hypothetical protein EGW08_016559 [Elysia chlorotica]
MVYRSESGAEGLIKRLRETFVTFGVPEEITTDGGPQFTAGKTKEFLSSWGVHHRVTSVANPHANCRAEIAVKSAKRMLMDNTGPTGSLDVDKFQKAMLIFRNTIDPETKASPALILFGRPIRDPIPIPMGRYCPHTTWTETLAHREKALAKCHAREHEKWPQHIRLLQPLKVGDRDEDASVPAPQPQPQSQVDDILDPPSEAPPSPTRDTNDTSTTPTNPTELPAQALPRALTRLLPHNKPGQSEQQPLGPPDKFCGVSAKAPIFTAEAVALCMALDSVSTSRKDKILIRLTRSLGFLGGLSLKPLQFLERTNPGTTAAADWRSEPGSSQGVFWPNITTDITRIREECTHCHRAAKSNPMQPPCDITPPDYPFQKIGADYFFNNSDYVVIVDRYSSWPMVYRSESGAEGLIKRLRETFVTFGVPEEITTDGEPEFTAGKTKEFLSSA